MGWDDGKKVHLELAERAADTYQVYGTTNSATRSYMLYEEHIVREVASQLTRRSKAIDLGCGEGRIAFVLSRLFADVRGYDMSPEMIRVADQRRLQEGRGNTGFFVRDVEHELLRDVTSGTIDLVVGSFGMGSFVERLDVLLGEIQRILRPGGKTILSFYNSQSLMHQLDIPADWQPSLAAVLDASGVDRLVVTFAGQPFAISARAYSVREVMVLVKAHFQSASTTTYPAISAILPQTVSGHPAAVEVCDRIDRALASQATLHMGAYILATATKDSVANCGDDRRLRGYPRVLEVLGEEDIMAVISEHAPANTLDEVRRLVEAPAERMLKSVLVAIEHEPAPRYLLCLVAAELRVSYAKVADVLGVQQDQVRLATSHELEEVTGFAVGAISPLGMPPNVPVVFDSSTRNALQDGDVWCGAGKRTETLKIKLSDLESVIALSVKDVAE